MSNENIVSVITGAGRGIGRAIAKEFAREGHSVILISRTEKDLVSLQHELQSSGAAAEYFAGDVADPDFASRTIQTILDKYKRIDHLINNAGTGIFKKLVDATLEEFQLQINTNLYGIFNFSKAVLPSMIGRKSGSIINISSLAGKNSFTGGTMYSASKHALMGLTRSLMLEVREYNIRVAAICPGSVETDFAAGSEMSPVNKLNVLMPEDIASVVLSVIKMPVRALMSEIDIRPTNPKK